MLHPITWSLVLPYYAAALLFGYLLGSTPFGLILTRLAGKGDIRTMGSGNIGATNVLRTGGKGLAALTLLGDAAKGAVAVWLTYRFYGQDMAILAGLGAVLGHCFPVWLRFNGGKGVATYLGVLLALSWPGAIGFAVVWLATAVITRFSSLAGLLSSAATPLILWMRGDRQEAQLFLLLTLLLWFKHRTNIARLIAGTEARIGRRSDRPAGD